MINHIGHFLAIMTSYKVKEGFQMSSFTYRTELNSQTGLYTSFFTDDDFAFVDAKSEDNDVESSIESYINQFDSEGEEAHEHLMCIKCCAVYEVESINAAYNAAGLDPKTFKCNCGCSQVLPMGRS
jgi:hypothetical protein